MVSNLLNGGSALLFAYLFILWLPITIPFEVEELLVEWILHPFGFLIGMTSLLFGAVCFVHFWHKVMAKTFSYRHRTPIEKRQLIASYFIMVTFLFLSYIGFWQMLIFYLIAFVYGMMTIDFRKTRRI